MRRFLLRRGEDVTGVSGTGDVAGCDTCAHLATSHEPDDYDADGAPIRPICCVPGCRCGEQWESA